MTRAKFIPLYKTPDFTGLGYKIEEVLCSGRIAVGAQTDRFEDMLRNFLGNPLVVANSDISTALTMCLYQAGVRPGDDVIMSPLVCLSTSCPVRNLFANICWCDVDPMTGNIDPAAIAKKVTPRTKAIVVYHWAGNPAELDAIQAVARGYGLAIIEDAGEALGAEYNGAKIGSTGSDFAVFSFYANRHISTIDGGAIACARERDFNQIRWLKRYGIHQPSFRTADGEINPSSDVEVAGWNSYLSHVAGTIGVSQMESIQQNVNRWRANGQYYDRMLLGAPGITLLRRPARSVSAYWVYTFLSRERDRLLALLRKEGIHASRVHIRNDRYTAFGSNHEVMPGVDAFARDCLSIPCGPWVMEEDRERIASVIRRGAA